MQSTLQQRLDEAGQAIDPGQAGHFRQADRSAGSHAEVAQQVNLLVDELRPAITLMDSKHLLIFAGGTLLLLLLISAYGAFRIHSLNTAEELATAQLKKLTDTSAVLTASFDARVDPALVEEVSDLKARIAAQQQLLLRLSDGDRIQRLGFSDYLGDLAKNHVDGMWFTQLHFSSGGRQIQLSGQTLDPLYVPQFLKKLARESRFVGHEFDRFELRAIDPPEGVPSSRVNPLEFTITGPDSGENE